MILHVVSIIKTEVKQAVSVFWGACICITHGRQVSKERNFCIVLQCSFCGSPEIIHAAEVFLRLALFFISLFFLNV